MMGNALRRRCVRGGWFLSVLAFGLPLGTTAAIAQPATIASHVEPYALDSGPLDNPSPAWAVVFSQVVQLSPATPWARLLFEEATLPGGSFLRVTSLLDADAQALDGQEVVQWGMGSAYFNGPALALELVAAPGTAANRVRISQALAGDPAPAGPAAQPETICPGGDTRLPSQNPAVCRLLFGPLAGGLCSGCTGFIVNRPAGALPAVTDKCLLSAGHCFLNPGSFPSGANPSWQNMVAQFDVPASNANCAIQHPPAAKQFAVDLASVQAALAPGSGNDWAVFRCFPSAGQTPFQAQNGVELPIAAALPPPPFTANVTGFGVDGSTVNGANNNDSCVVCPGPAPNTGVRNQAQQDAIGLLIFADGAEVRHQVNTCGANSGSPILRVSTGEVVGIHTFGVCQLAPAYNGGTQITYAPLAAAIAACAGLTTSDFGDAPLNAGVAQHLNAGVNVTPDIFGLPIGGPGIRLGVSVTAEAAPPIPSWYGDAGDDGISSWANLFPGSANAVINVHVRNPGANPIQAYVRVWVRRTALTVGWDLADAFPIQTALVPGGGAPTIFNFGPFAHPAATGAPSPYVRVRVSQNPLDLGSAVGLAGSGEVEDYVLPGTGGAVNAGLAGGGGSDAGDAPSPYPPVNSRVINSERLGTAITADAAAPVGPPFGFNADGGDDGLLGALRFGPGQCAFLVVRATNPNGPSTAVLSAWADWNGDGDWDDAGEAFPPEMISASPFNPLNPNASRYVLGALGVPAATVNPIAVRLKINFHDASFAYLAAGASFDFGEIEDYLLLRQRGGGCRILLGSGSMSGPEPSIWAPDPPRIGLPFTLYGSDFLPATLVLLVLGSPPLGPPGVDLGLLGLPIPTNLCFLQVPPSVTLPVGLADPSGGIAVGFSVPGTPALVGATLYGQGFQITPTEFLATAGLDATVLP